MKPKWLRAGLSMCFWITAGLGIGAGETRGTSVLGTPAAACVAPAERGDGLTVGTPAEMRFDASALCALLSGVARGGDNIHSVLVLRHGRLVAELYLPGRDQTIWSLWKTHTGFGPDSLHDMRSTTKSVVALLYGILLARGDVPALDTSVASLYPGIAVPGRGEKAAIRIRDLMTMSAGLAWQEASPVRRLMGPSDELGLLWRTDPYGYVFSFRAESKPGTQFVYSGGATALIADIMTRSTGRDLIEIARSELFEPMGIDGWTWTRNLWGKPLAAAGLRLKPRDLARIGLMLLDRGRWQGRQLVPAAWISEATRPHISAGPDDAYGYQFWTRDVNWHGTRVHAAATVGNGGQTLVVVPSLDLAIVTTAGNYGTLEGLKRVRDLEQEIIETAL
jgi:CubicO group peptidase (beta-lactamase class C family)